MTLYQLKPWVQRQLRPAVRWLAAAGVTANQVTIGTGVASVVLGLGVAVTQRGWILLPVFLLVRMLLNAVDGMLAREHGQQSKLGAILNELLDVLSDAALTLPLAVLPGWNALLVAGMILFAALTEMAGMLGAQRRYDGPFGKSDRALALGVLAFWIAVDWPVHDRVPVAVPVVWMAFCVATMVNRVRSRVPERGSV